MGKYSFKRKNERPWPNSRLGMAVIIGHTTGTSARIWVRTDDENKEHAYRFLYFDRKQRKSEKDLGEIFEELRWKEKINKDDLNPFNSVEISPKENSDTTCVIDLKSLKPDTKYSYAIWSVNDCALVLGHDKRRRFSTPSEDGGFAFGLFSCHNPFGRKGEKVATEFGPRRVPVVHNMGLWNTARLAFDKDRDGKRVDFLIGGGDQAYCDGSDALDIWKYLEKVLKDRKPSDGFPDQEDMLSWYREMYRGYWGFASVQAVFGRYPTYMIWDDHEIRDGWGSYKIRSEGEEIEKILFDGWKKYLSLKEAKKVIWGMFEAAKQAYGEYQNCHNPDPEVEGGFDYSFVHKGSLFYVLDGRGHRDFDRASNKILGKEQLTRFGQKVKGLDKDETPFLFVVSAVPFLHTSSFVFGDMLERIIDAKDLTDDLRDAWEHKAHDSERKEMLDILFGAAERGIKACILSGDVHMSAVFRMQRKEAVIYQLTSSAITYNTSKVIKIMLKGCAASDGRNKSDEYKFNRDLLMSDPSFAIVLVDDKSKDVSVKFYQDRMVDGVRIKDSLAKFKLDFHKA